MSKDDIPVQISPGGECYMSEAQHRKLGLLMGWSEEEIAKDWEKWIEVDLNE